MRRDRESTGSFADFVADWRRRVMSRRQFLIRALGSTALFTTAGSPGLGAAAETMPGSAGTAEPAPPKPSPARQWQILLAVQQQLFPSGPDTPGASDFNAGGYLQWVLADPKLDPVEKDFLYNGIGWLEDLTQTTTGQSFLALDNDGREQMLVRISQSRAGENWLATVLMYLFEALLSDPMYGGNTDAIGWRWLHHQPGFPRPPADKLYGKL